MHHSNKEEIRAVVQAARNLIEKPENWTQRAFARDSNGRITDHTSESAICWCASGALGKVIRQDHNDDYDYEAMWGAVSEYLPLNIPTLNDEGTHTDILNMFDSVLADLST